MGSNRERETLTPVLSALTASSGVAQRSFSPVASAPDHFSVIDQQVDALRNLARMVSDIMNGKQSAHAAGVLEIELQCDEVRRQNDTVIRALCGSGSDLDEVRLTLESLERAAAGLWRIVAGFKGSRWSADQGSRRMMTMVEKAIQSLGRGNRRLAKGYSAASLDAAAAIASHSHWFAQRGSEPRSTVGADAQAARQGKGNGVMPPAFEYGAQDLFVRTLQENVAQVGEEIAIAAGCLKDWSQRIMAMG